MPVVLAFYMETPVPGYLYQLWGYLYQLWTEMRRSKIVAKLSHTRLGTPHAPTKYASSASIESFRASVSEIQMSHGL